jgi:MerR family mercuric resistance operon transcriptional regulator
MKPFTIGKLARESGVGVETVRFYERKGLIARPPLKEGFRKYSEEEAKRIRFIRRAQELGFTLKEIKGLLELNSNPQSTCSDVKIQAAAKMKEIEEKVRDLKKMKRSLKSLFEACGESKEALARCPMFDCFEPGRKCK